MDKFAAKINRVPVTIAPKPAAVEDEITKQKREAREFISKSHPYPNTYSNRGIVMCAGGWKYLPGAWITINMLRRFGCKLPIQIWHFGEKEAPKNVQEIFNNLGVTWIDIEEVKKVHPMDNLRGWEAKPYSIVYSPYQEVLYLDADNLPVKNPEFLFDDVKYKAFGAMFWPDFNRLGSDRPIWGICDITYRDEPEFESGQILVNKTKCWKALMLTLFYNERSPFYYKYVHGDKETYHLAWRRLNQPYVMCPTMKGIDSTMIQHDPSGAVIFQHRNMDKWSLTNKNKVINGFKFESECRELLTILGNKVIDQRIKV